MSGWRGRWAQLASSPLTFNPSLCISTRLSSNLLQVVEVLILRFSLKIPAHLTQRSLKDEFVPILKNKQCHNTYKYIKSNVNNHIQQWSHVKIQKVK